ncbi:MAG: hypothetical protein M5R36_05575 [Deltaproteobacteria bacterium]|nr:hypothetical protein [Deltaproteobacteria bacterium]
MQHLREKVRDTQRRRQAVLGKCVVEVGEILACQGVADTEPREVPFSRRMTHLH